MIDIIALNSGQLEFQALLSWTAGSLRDLTLNVGSTSLAFEDASQSSGLLRWTNTGLTWSEDDMIALSIDADPPPMLLTAQVETATTLALIFDQGLDSSSLPATSAFAVTVNGSSNSVSSAAFNTANDGVILTVGTAMSAWDTVVVTYTKPATDPIQDAAGNETESFTQELENLLRDTLVSNLGQTSVSGVLNLSSSDASQAFTTGPTVDAYTLTGVKVKFDTVPTAAATVSVFIADGQTATDNIVVNLTNPDTWSATSTFGIPSGTTLAANTTYYVIIEGSDGTLHRTASNNEDAGAVTGWSIANTSAGRGASSSGLGGTWTPQSAKAQISIEGIHKGIPGIPDLTLTAKDQTLVLEVVISDHGREDLTDIEYRYKATASGTYTEWTSVTGTVTNTGGTFEITGLTNGTEYIVQVQGVNDSGDGLPSSEESATPDAPPAITSVAITSDPGADKTYAIDDDIVVTFTFDKNITISGSGQRPRFLLNIGTIEKFVQCAVDTPPTMVMTCTHTVVENDEDTDGIGVDADSVVVLLNNQRIIGPLGQFASLDHDALAEDSDHKVDGVRPELTGARASADKMKITLTFSEAIGAVDRTKITFDSSGTTLSTTAHSTTGSEVEITLTNALGAMDTNVTVALAADAVTDAVGNGNAVLPATAIVDETAPELSMATTPSNTEVLLTYNEPLDANSIPAASAFAVAVGVTEVWSATLTVKEFGTLSQLGCHTGETNKGCTSAELLTDETFSYAEVDYSLEVVALNGGTLRLEYPQRNLTPAERADLVLWVGDRSFRFADASAGSHQLSWSNTGLTWSEDDVVELRIQDWSNRTVSTVSAAVLDGTSAIKLTVSPAFRPGDELTVSYTVPDSNPIKDASENEAVALSSELVDNTLDATAPDMPGSLAANFNLISFVPPPVFNADLMDISWTAPWHNGSPIEKFQYRYHAPIWAGTLTVKDIGANFLGCDTAETNKGCEPGELLTDNTFSYDSVDYTIGGIYASAGNLSLDTNVSGISAAALADLTLHVGGDSFPFADATVNVGLLTWTGTGLSWSEDDTVQLAIRAVPAWTDVPDSAPGGANHTSYTVSGLDVDTGYTFEVRAKNGIDFGAAASVTKRTRGVLWSFTLRDGSATDVTELIEGGDSAAARVTITNDSRFSTDQEITLEWGGFSLEDGRIQGAGNTSTITITAGASTGHLDISAPDNEVNPVYFPLETADLTAKWEGAVIGTIMDLRRIDDESPPVARITDAPESVNEGDSFDVDIELSVRYPNPGAIKFTITDGDSALSGTLPNQELLIAGTLTATISLTAAENTVQNDGAHEVTFTLETSTDYPLHPRHRRRKDGDDHRAGRRHAAAGGGEPARAGGQHRGDPEVAGAAGAHAGPRPAHTALRVPGEGGDRLVRLLDDGPEQRRHDHKPQVHGPDQRDGVHLRGAGGERRRRRGRGRRERDAEGRRCGLVRLGDGVDHRGRLVRSHGDAGRGAGDGSDGGGADHAVAGRGAGHASEYSGVPASVTFTAGDTSKRIHGVGGGRRAWTNRTRSSRWSWGRCRTATCRGRTPRSSSRWWTTTWRSGRSPFATRAATTSRSSPRAAPLRPPGSRSPTACGSRPTRLITLSGAARRSSAGSSRA